MNFRSASELWIESCRNLVSPPRGVALPWWPSLNAFIGSLRPNELSLLCAPTGAGKTTLLANISTQMMLQGIPQFVAPVETGDLDFMARVMSVLARSDLNNGDAVSMETLKAISGQYAEMIKSTPLFISSYENRVEISEMINLLKFMHQEHGVKIALLDNLNFFLKVTSSTMEKAEMDSAIHEFVMLAKKIPMHIILIVHPKKTGDEGRVESEFDIKGSSTAVQEASNVIVFNRPKREDIESGKRQASDRELVFKKCRKRGQIVNRPVWFRYKDCRFEEIRS